MLNSVVRRNFYTRRRMDKACGGGVHGMVLETTYTQWNQCRLVNFAERNAVRSTVADTVTVIAYGNMVGKLRDVLSKRFTRTSETRICTGAQ